jgi:glycosyltransferase involved in cell wall biosynthesis
MVAFDPGDDGTAVRGLLAALPAIEVRTVPAPRLADVRAAVLGLVTRTPYPIWRVRSRAFRSVVRELYARGDIGRIVVEVAYMYPYADLSSPRHCTIVDTHNIDSLVLQRYAETMRGVRRWYAGMTARKLAVREAATFRTADEVWVCSQAEAGYLERVVPEARVSVVPNGVDTSFFSPGDRHAGEPRTRSVLFFGRLDYYPNADAIRHFIDAVLPGIWARDPTVRFDLAGQGELDQSVRRLAAVDARVRLHGAVQDLRPIIAHSAVVVVPLRSGGGTRLKILEALAMARPVVSTTVGMEGLDLSPGEHLEVADDAQDFADRTLELLNDRERAETLGRRGREAVVGRYDWRGIEGRIRERIRDNATTQIGRIRSMDRHDPVRVPLERRTAE